MNWLFATYMYMYNMHGQVAKCNLENLSSKMIHTDCWTLVTNTHKHTYMQTKKQAPEY